MGFRTPAGELTALERFKTVELPRQVRGKKGAWDASVCLNWGCDVLRFLHQSVSRESLNLNCSEDWKHPVWRLKFDPLTGLRLRRLGEEEVERVFEPWANYRVFVTIRSKGILECG